VTRNDSDLDRLSADLDEELDAIFDQVAAALNQGNDQLAGERRAQVSEADPTMMADEPEDTLPAIAPADLLADEHFLSEDLDIDVTLENTPPFDGPATVKADWLEPGLLGEPLASAGLLTPEMVGELSRIIEAAVEKGVAKGVAEALAKMRG
jgi:hypothetical protein